MRRVIAGGSLGVAALAGSLAAGCGAAKGSAEEGSARASLPLVTPPVMAATPIGLGGSGMGSLHPNNHLAGLRLNDFPVGVGAYPDGASSASVFDASPGDAGLGPGPGLGPDRGGVVAVGVMCPGSGGVCPPDGDAGNGPSPDGAMMDPPPAMCPGSGGVCPPDGDAGNGPSPDGAMMDPPPAMCPGIGGICPDGGTGPGGAMAVEPDGGIRAGAAMSLDPSDIRSRFFSEGPTNIFSILTEIDDRIREINQRSKDQNVPCLSLPPMAYTLTPFGQSVPFYAQCVSHISTPTPSSRAFFQFGQKDGITYLYEAVGAQTIGARLTPASDGSGQYAVDAWIGVGYDNAASCGNASGFDDCSYGVMALKADPSHMHFELTVAGIGFGYCGAQLESEGTTVAVQGSADMGATCRPRATVCVSATDLTMTEMCAPASFDLPTIGRAGTSGPNGTWGASQNGSDGIVLDGTASDSLAFGPSIPTPGVPEFSMSPGGGPSLEGGMAAPMGDAAPE